jgi:uncharacterized membrane protein
MNVRLPQVIVDMTGRKEITLSRALAKTITFRTLATIMDFTTIYVFVGNLATAAGLSAFGFVVGPFVYWGHEKAWDYYTSADKPPVALLPKPNLRLSPPA